LSKVGAWREVSRARRACDRVRTRARGCRSDAASIDLRYSTIVYRSSGGGVAAFRRKTRLLGAMKQGLVRNEDDRHRKVDTPARCIALLMSVSDVYTQARSPSAGWISFTTRNNLMLSTKKTSPLIKELCLFCQSLSFFDEAQLRSEHFKKDEAWCSWRPGLESIFVGP